MDAVKFFKTVNMLCKNQSCEECPVYKNDMCCMVGFDDDSIKSIEETVSKVEQWEKEHPANTRQDKFLKVFPNPDFSHRQDGIPGASEPGLPLRRESGREGRFRARYHTEVCCYPCAVRC